MSEVRVSSWIELQEAVVEGAWQEPLTRHRSQYVFRRLPRARHGLETSLQAGGFEAHERHLLTSFRKYALRNAVHGDWLLAVARETSRPADAWRCTSRRTTSATSTKTRRSGASTTARPNELLPKPLRKVLADEDVNLFTTELLNRFATTLDDLVVFFEPPSLDERIVNQFALFSLPSSARIPLEALITQREESYRRIVIPAALKWEVRDKLDQANITERCCFRDSMACRSG